MKRSVWSSQADFHLLQDLLDQNLKMKHATKWNSATDLKFPNSFRLTWTNFRGLAATSSLSTMPCHTHALPPFWFRYAKYPGPLHCLEALLLLQWTPSTWMRLESISAQSYKVSDEATGSPETTLFYDDMHFPQRSDSEDYWVRNAYVYLYDCMTI